MQVIPDQGQAVQREASWGREHQSLELRDVNGFKQRLEWERGKTERVKSESSEITRA